MPGGSRESNQYYSRRFHVADEYQPAEVFVFGQQNSVIRPREFHQLPIDGSPLHLAYGQYIMAFRARGSHNHKVTALVREEAHRLQLAVAERHN